MQKSSKLKIYTVELDTSAYGFCAARFLFNHKVNVSLGNSRDFLKRHLAQEKYKNAALFFYLDAHSKDDLPLFEECEAILVNISNAVIMIDDFKVEGDEGYFYDDYGESKKLCLEYLKELKKYSYKIFFPSANSEEETGKKRGCVVLSNSEELTERIQKLRTLKEYAEMPIV